MSAVPFTYSQKVLYYVDTQLRQMHIVRCVRIKGPIELGRFECAAAELMVRHPILGSRLELINGEPMQRQGNKEASFKLFDIEDLTDQQIDQILSTQADAPIDLFSENPFRVVLARTASDTAYLLLIGNHVFFDGDALQTLLIEYLSLTLSKSVNKADASWDNGDRSFLAYALKQHKMEADGAFTRTAQYWVNKLKDSDPALHFPARGAEPAAQSTATVPFRLDRNSFLAFSGRARRLQVSNFALAATSVFHAIREITDQDRILLATVADARRPPFDRTIGNFAGMYLIEQARNNGGMGDDAVLAIFEETIQAMVNYVPQFLFADEIWWLRERLGKGFSMTDGFMQYLPIQTSFSRTPAWPEHEISPVTLTARTQPTSVPYHGIAMEIVMIPGLHSLSGWVSYESALIDSSIATTAADLIRNQLTLES